MSRARVSLSRLGASAPATKRRCNHCGDFIDPADWCGSCQKLGKPCATSGGPHERLFKRADAEYCDAVCRAARRSTFIRDCL